MWLEGVSHSQNISLRPACHGFKAAAVELAGRLQGDGAWQVVGARPTCRRGAGTAWQVPIVHVATINNIVVYLRRVPRNRAAALQAGVRAAQRYFVLGDPARHCPARSYEVVSLSLSSL